MFAVQNSVIHERASSKYTTKPFSRTQTSKRKSPPEVFSTSWHTGTVKLETQSICWQKIPMPHCGQIDYELSFYHHSIKVACTLYIKISYPVGDAPLRSPFPFWLCADQTLLVWNIIILGSPEISSVGAWGQPARPVDGSLLFLTQLSLCAQHTHPRQTSVTVAQHHLMNWDGPRSKGSMC